MRRIVNDAERILNDIDRLDIDAEELNLVRGVSHHHHAAEKIGIPDTQYASDFWQDVDDEGPVSVAVRLTASQRRHARPDTSRRSEANPVSAPTADRTSSGTGVFSPTRAQITQRTLRTDNWRKSPLITDLGFAAFVIYATVRAFLQDHYFVADYHYLTPFYSPCISDRLRARRPATSGRRSCPTCGGCPTRRCRCRSCCCSG